MLKRSHLLLAEAGLVIAWSSGFIGARLAADTSSFFLVLFWRFVIVALLLAWPLARALRSGLSARAVALQAALGALAMFGYLALGVAAIARGVPVGTAALISALQPIATAALAGPLLGERVTGRQWLGLLLGLGGIAAAVGGGTGQAPPAAYLLSLASMASLVAATLLAKAAPTAMPLLPMLAIQSGTTALLLAPLALADGSLAPVPEPHFLAAVAWFVLLSTLGAYGLYWLCLRHASATRVASLIYLTPPVTMLWAWAMFAEPIAATALLGFALCLAGVALAGDPATLARARPGCAGCANARRAPASPTGATGAPAPDRPGADRP